VTARNHATRWNRTVSSKPSALATRSRVARVGSVPPASQAGDHRLGHAGKVRELPLGEPRRLALAAHLTADLIGPAGLLVAGLGLRVVGTPFLDYGKTAAIGGTCGALREP
jgi:hypothetical protein